MSFKFTPGNHVRVKHLYSTTNEREMRQELYEIREDLYRNEHQHHNAFAVKDGAPLARRSPYVTDRYGLAPTKLVHSGEENSWKNVETYEQSRSNPLTNHHLKKLDIL